MARQFAGYDDFYPWYVSQHSKPLTRRFHFVGTHAGAAAAVVAIATRRPALLAAFPVISYATAWFSHFVIEKNNPASFGHPLWSLRGDVRMLATMWQGRDAELTRLAESVREEETLAA